MNSTQVDSFSSRLNAELSALDWKARNELFIRIGRAELKMRSAGQERPIWAGPLPESDILGADVVVPTDQGERRGRVVCFGVVNIGAQGYERSVVIHVPASGTQHEAAGSLARLASPEDSRRIQNEMEMASKLAEASAAAQKGPTPLPATPPRKRGQKDPRLVERMVQAAKDSNNVMAVEEGAANFKVVGRDPTKRIYVFKNQLRVDVSGFSFDHPGLRRISDEEARDMHLGKVRGQVLFDSKEQALAAFEKALEGLT